MKSNTDTFAGTGGHSIGELTEGVFDAKKKTAKELLVIKAKIEDYYTEKRKRLGR